MEPVKPFEQPEPDILETREGGGCLGLFGLPFLVAGIFVELIAFGIIPVENREALPAWAGIVLPLFGLPFVGVGVWLVLGRQGLIIDRRLRRLVRWKGLLGPMKRRETPLDGLRCVTFSLEADEGSTSYRVELAGRTAAEKVPIYRGSDFVTARRASETLARFLRLPLEDDSSGRRVVREPERLDESIQERARRLDETVSLPPRPLTMRARLSEHAEGVEVFIPVGGRGGHILALAIPVAIGLFAYFKLGALLRGPDVPVIVRFVFGGFLLLFAGLPAAGALVNLLWKGRNHWRVRADATRLRIEEKQGFKRKTTEIPAAEIESFDYGTYETMLERMSHPNVQAPSSAETGNTGVPRLPDGRPMPTWVQKIARFAPSRGITAASDTAMVNFGARLPHDELAYLHARLLRALLGQ